MGRLAALAAVALAGLAAACAGGDGASAPSDGAPEGALAGYSVEQLARGLEAPWGIAFLPGGDVLLTERPGRVRLVLDGALVPEAVAEIPVAARGEAGLLGLALHPGYPAEPFAYVYATREDGGLVNRVSRFRVAAGGPAGIELVEEEVVLDGIPAAAIHDGGRLAFGPDGFLYVATGEAGEPFAAADPGSLGGKILRLQPEGGIPAGNPFAGSPVWSFGHRNPQGLVWDDGGRLYVAEHGPSGEFGLCCLDEVNLVEAGGFYGWPFRAARTQVIPPEQAAPPAEPIDPIASSGGEEAWAPSGIALDDPADGPASLLVATLRGSRLLRLVLDASGREVVRVETVLEGYGRLRDVVVGPGGCLYVLTSNRDGRGEPAEGDDRLLRLCPP